MLDMLDHIGHSSIDSIVTDPPYELNFMNKGWDNSGVAFQSDTWKKCYEVLKPGGYLLAFGGSRTFHRIAVAIEDAGFEIRDTIMWLYGSGFPKSMNLGKAIESKLTTGSANTQEWKNLDGTKTKSGNWGLNANNEFYGARPSDYSADGHERTVDVDYSTEEGKKWDGWGTALKPAYEPIIVARKPCEGSVTDNVLKYGVGGLNIDECRIGTDVITTNGARKNPMAGDERTGKALGMFQETEALNIDHNGRFPSNVILTYDETDEQEVCGGMPYSESNGGRTTSQDFRDVGQKSKEAIGIDKLSFGQTSNAKRIDTGYVAPMDSGSAARYFYCAKASKKDRDEGLGKFIDKVGGGMIGTENQSLLTGSGNVRNNLRKNTHPTVKPMELMQYLVKLVTPKNGIILDPFNGSGSTGKAVVFENRATDKNYKYIGIELNKEYLAISKARIDYANTVNLSAVNKADIISENTSMLF